MIFLCAKKLNLIETNLKSGSSLPSLPQRQKVQDEDEMFFYQTIRSNWNKFVERQFVAITTATTKCSRWMCFLICNKHQESKLNENRTYKTRRRKTHERAYVPQASWRSCLKRYNIKETEYVNLATIPNHSASEGRNTENTENKISE